jgi:hypothetical protein
LHHRPSSSGHHNLTACARARRRAQRCLRWRRHGVRERKHSQAHRESSEPGDQATKNVSRHYAKLLRQPDRIDAGQDPLTFTAGGALGPPGSPWKTQRRYWDKVMLESCRKGSRCGLSSMPIARTARASPALSMRCRWLPASIFGSCFACLLAFVWDEQSVRTCLAKTNTLSQTRPCHLGTPGPP